MSQPLQIPAGTYALADPRAGSRRLIGCFAQAAPQLPQLGPNPDDSKQKTPPITLRRAAGIRTLANNGTTNPVRGMDIMQGVVYAVIGPTLYTLSQSGVLTQVGTGIAGGTGFVRVTNNTQCLVVLVPGSTLAYTYVPGTGLVQIAASGFTSLGAIDMGYLDSYIVFLQANGQGFFNDDGRAISGSGAITFTTASQFLRTFGTDLFVGMAIDHRSATMYGTNTAETYIDVGNTVGSPFSSAPDGFIELGCAANYSVAKQDQAPYWLANDLTIRRKSGQTPLRVSNHGIEAILATANFAGAYALTFSYEGHLFYALTMPAIQRTVVLDVTTGEWHELSSFGVGSWRPLCSLQAYGKQLLGDSLSGKIGFLDSTIATEFDTVQICSWTHQPVYNGNARLSHRRVELILGAGLATTYGKDPLVTMEVSDDGGETFRKFQTRSLGQRGKYNNRVVWTNCGTSRQRVYRFSFSDVLMSSWIPDLQVDAVPGRY